jgi:signal transduction histidine kinase
MRTGALTSAGLTLGDDARAWIRAAADGRDRHEATPHPRVMAFEPLDGAPRAVAGRFIRSGGTHVMFAGFVAEPAAFDGAFRRVLEGSPLLPATLAGSRNDMLGLHVRTRAGAPVFTSAEPSGPVSADGVLDDAIGGLAYRITLHPDAAGHLIIGGLPRSRLPLLLGLLTLTAGLLLVAVLQLRREHDLARMRADFVSSVTHELRTPLAQIRLFSETLLLGRVRSEAEGRRSLEIIQQESRRLAHLVDNVLYFSRTARGGASLCPVPTSLGPVIGEVLEMFDPLAQAAGATLRLDVREDGPAMVDTGAFRQILLNLLDNAVKYGRPDQTIAVTLERRGRDIRLSVDDEGPGVPGEARERIWQPYWRLASAAASGVAGTGIGLAVVRDLAALHGGTASVEDAPGGGARFVVVLPVGMPQGLPQPVAPGETSGAHA